MFPSFQKNVDVEREVEEELERDTISEYVMMNDDEDIDADDSDIVGTDAEVNVKLLYITVIDY
jgi:hypothetical protein